MLVRRRSQNLYDRVRALFFLSTIYRDHLPERFSKTAAGRVPFDLSGLQSLNDTRKNQVSLGTNTAVTTVDGESTTVCIAANDASASETGPDRGQFTVTFGTVVRHDVVVSCNITGSAINATTMRL